MKISSLVIILGLIAALPVLAKDGGRDSGGGFYGKVQGQWILLDELEEGVPLDVNIEPFKSHVEKVTRKIHDLANSVPEFARELTLPLQKKWHLVDFEISCEDPESMLKIEKSAGACQNDNDVFVEKSKYETSPERLITHELVQGVRLSKNKTPHSERISPADVRAITTAIKNEIYRDESKFVGELEKYGFGKYETSAEFKARREREISRANKLGQLEQQETATLNVFNEVCLRNLDIQNAQDRTNALNAISKAQFLITDLLNKIDLLKQDQDFLGEPEAPFFYFKYSEFRNRKTECGRKQQKIGQIQYP
ncbi:MAG: hypothetical protein A4S09_16180 [Proteobacteria bacterium SG_bin7]|nr:MAG: hypothetical protein A4S09_16180 [Proteobacteria bacterium SG_bin7]